MPDIPERHWGLEWTSSFQQKWNFCCHQIIFVHSVLNALHKHITSLYPCTNTSYLQVSSCWFLRWLASCLCLAFSWSRLQFRRHVGAARALVRLIWSHLLVFSQRLHTNSPRYGELPAVQADHWIRDLGKSRSRLGQNIPMELSD